MVIYNIPNKGYQRNETIRAPFTTLEEVMCEGKTQGKSARSLSGRQPEDKKPSMKGTPPMETPKVPDLTMIHADLLHY
jgi:hypothetical protein